MKAIATRAKFHFFFHAGICINRATSNGCAVFTGVRLDAFIYRSSYSLHEVEAGKASIVRVFRSPFLAPRIGLICSDPSRSPPPGKYPFISKQHTHEYVLWLLCF